MNEPNSVIAGKLQLIILAGKTKPPAPGFPPANILDIAEIKHVVATDSVVYPGASAPPYHLINFVVPRNQCLVVDYVSLYTTPDDLSTLQVNYGMNDSYTAQWLIRDGAAARRPLTPLVETQGVVNGPCFVVFPQNSTATLDIDTTGAAAPDVNVMVRMNGYLLDSNLYTLFAKHQTIFSNP